MNVITWSAGIAVAGVFLGACGSAGNGAGTEESSGPASTSPSVESRSASAPSVARVSTRAMCRDYWSALESAVLGMDSAEKMANVTQAQAAQQVAVLEAAAAAGPIGYEDAWQQVAVPWQEIANGAAPVAGEITTEPLKAGAMTLVEACTPYATAAATPSASAPPGPTTTITEGTWMVGRDVVAGTYSPNAPVAAECYWEISQGGEIVDNDLPGGGLPTVTLSDGQQFKTRSCGTWSQQGG